MATNITGIAPAANSFLEVGDSFTCVIDHTSATEVLITIDGETAWSLTGGAGAGFTIDKVTSSEVTTINIKRTAGWAGSVVSVSVEVTAGTYPGTASWQYYVGVQTEYPGKQPYNDTLETEFTVLEDGVEVASGVNVIDIRDGLNATKTGEKRVRVDADAVAGGGLVGLGTYTCNTAGGAPASGAFTVSASDTSIAFTHRLHDQPGDATLPAGGWGGLLQTLQSGSKIVYRRTGDIGDTISYNISAVVNNASDTEFTINALYTPGTTGFFQNGEDYYVEVWANFAPTTAGTDFTGGLGSWLYDNSSTSGAGIASGDFRLNNANPTLATELYIADLNTEGINMAATIDNLTGREISLWNDGGTDGGTFTIGQILNNTGYYTLVLTGKVTTSSFTNNDRFVVSDLGPTAGYNFSMRSGFAAWACAGVAGGAPSSSTMTFDSATLSSVTSINVHDTAEFDDVSGVLLNLKEGDHISIREKAGTSSGVFKVLGVTDNTTYVTITLSAVHAGGTVVVGRTYEVMTLHAGLHEHVEYSGRLVTTLAPVYLRNANSRWDTDGFTIEAGSTQGTPDQPGNPGTGWTAPWNGKVLRVRGWVKLAVSTDTGSLELWKWTPTDNSASLSGSELGFSGGFYQFPGSGVSGSFREIDVTFNSSNTFAAGDQLDLLAYTDQNSAGIIILDVVVTVERTE